MAAAVEEKLGVKFERVEDIEDSIFADKEGNF